MNAFKSSSFALAAMLFVASGSGCFSATIHLADGASTPSPVVDGAYHVNLFELIELSSPVDLYAACGNRQPVSIDEGLTALGGIVNFVITNIAPIVSFMNTSVNCGVASGPPG